MQWLFNWPVPNLRPAPCGYPDYDAVQVPGIARLPRPEIRAWANPYTAPTKYFNGLHRLYDNAVIDIAGRPRPVVDPNAFRPKPIGGVVWPSNPFLSREE